MNPSLAVIVPAYNSARFLQDLVSSVYGGPSFLGDLPGQTVQPDELVICDDCSTDNTEQVVQNLKLKYPDIVYVKTDVNSGTPVACNVAIRATKCDVITRIDSDDLRESLSYEQMLSILADNPKSFVYDNIRIVTDKGRQREWSLPEFDLKNLLVRNFIHAGIMFTRKSWESCGGYREKFRRGRDDWSFNVALATSGFIGIHCKYPGYLYRRSGQNRSLTNGSSEWQERFCLQMLEEFKEIYRENNLMACCGNRVNNVTSPSQPTSRTMVVGQNGFSILVYHGTNIGTETYFGPVTGSPYRFSTTRNRANVDIRDLHTARNTGLLDLVIHGKQLFTEELPQNTPDTAEVLDKDLPELSKVADSKATVEDSGTKIEVDQIEWVDQEIISSLSSAGIVTWEQFVEKPTPDLKAITGKGVALINKTKRELVS